MAPNLWLLVAFAAATPVLFPDSQNASMVNFERPTGMSGAAFDYWRESFRLE